MTETEAPSLIPIGYTALQGSPIQLTPLQDWMAPHVGGISAFYWVLWGGTALFLLSRFILIPLISRRS